MCGRFSLTLKKEEIQSILLDVFGDTLTLSDWHHQPRFNIAPSQTVLAILFDGVSYRVGPLTWGLVPAFATDRKIGFQMINAKTETLFEKPSFKNLIDERRCLILADGFYEWSQETERKAPHYITMPQEGLFAFAGLYDKNLIVASSPLWTTTILTQASQGVMTAIHHRAPCMIPKTHWKTYLQPQNESSLHLFFQQRENPLLHLLPVSRYVNTPSHEGPQCIEPEENTSLF